MVGTAAAQRNATSTRLEELLNEAQHEIALEDQKLPGVNAVGAWAGAAMKVDKAQKDATSVVLRHKELFPRGPDGSYNVPSSLKLLQGANRERQQELIKAGLRNNVAQCFRNHGISAETSLAIADLFISKNA